MTDNGRHRSEAHRLPSLPPRLRRVLAHLLRGLSEKEVARATGLSPHTVHQYVKLLYRRLGVGSRGQLMARWFDSVTAGAAERKRRGRP